jgi:glycerophosphoryl diester phosphodiesterase
MDRRVLFASEHLSPIVRVRELAPEIPTNLPAPEVLAFIQASQSGSLLSAPAGDALQIPPEHGGVKLATPEVVGAAHRNGLEVHIWTVNDVAQMTKMLTLGVDGIITDYPTRLFTLLRTPRQGESSGRA